MSAPLQSGSFSNLYEHWRRGTPDVKEALDGIAQMLAGTARTYPDTEDQLAAQLRA